MTLGRQLFKVGRAARSHIDGDRIARRKGLLERRVQPTLDVVSLHHRPSVPAAGQRSVTGARADYDN